MKTKNRKNKWLRILVGYLMLMVMIVAVIPAVPSEASAKSVALSKYRQLLSKSRISVLPQGKKIMGDDYREIRYYSSASNYVKFNIAYIDADDVPELILHDTRYGYGVWTFKGGYFRCLQWGDFYDFPVGYYKKKGIFRINATTEDFTENITNCRQEKISGDPASGLERGRQTGKWGFYIQFLKKVSSAVFTKPEEIALQKHRFTCTITQGQTGKFIK